MPEIVVDQYGNTRTIPLSPDVGTDRAIVLRDGTGKSFITTSARIDSGGNLLDVLVDIDRLTYDAGSELMFLRRAATTGEVVNTSNPPLDELQHTHQNTAGGGQLTDAALSAAVGLAKGGTNASLSAASRAALTLHTGDTAVTLRKMGGYEHQAWTVLGGNATSITISSIPNTFNILRLLVNLRTDRAGAASDGLLLRPNNDTSAANYQTSIYFTRTTPANAENLGATATLVASIPLAGATETAGYFTMLEIVIANYASVANFRTCTITGFDSSQTTGALAGLLGGGTWKDSSNAISSLVLAPQNGTNFVAGSGYGLWLF